jgi:hypothetical protein
MKRRIRDPAAVAAAVSAAEINIYLRSQLLNLRGVNLTPQQGRLLDPNFAEGEFLFRISNSGDLVDSAAARIEELKRPQPRGAERRSPPPRNAR